MANENVTTVGVVYKKPAQLMSLGEKMRGK
jgi:hypothetical protein